MLMNQKGIDWNNFSPREKRGSVIKKEERHFVRKDVDPVDDGKTHVIDKGNIYTRNVWEADPETLVFSQEKRYLRRLMPQSLDDIFPME
jgi:hypothetical protein